MKLETMLSLHLPRLWCLLPPKHLLPVEILCVMPFALVATNMEATRPTAEPFAAALETPTAISCATLPSMLARPILWHLWCLLPLKHLLQANPPHLRCLLLLKCLLLASKQAHLASSAWRC